MERGPSFNRPPDGNQSPEGMSRNRLRSEMLRLRSEVHDELSREILEKILGKLDIKDRVEELDATRDDPTIYGTWKRLGIFVVIDRASEIDWNDSDSNFEVKKGERVLDIHLPPVSKDKLSPQSVRSSLEQIAQYIFTHNLNPKYVMGVTFERLAKVSQRQGFSVVEPVLPDHIRHGVERVYERFGHNGTSKRGMGKILLCYQQTSQFLERHLK